jgi:hypothetical protein
MIVDNLYPVGIFLSPLETDSPLVINPNAVLPRTISRELFQPVRGRNPKILKRYGTI